MQIFAPVIAQTFKVKKKLSRTDASPDNHLLCQQLLDCRGQNVAKKLDIIFVEQGDV